MCCIKIKPNIAVLVYTLPVGNAMCVIGDVSGTQVRQQVRGRSKFGLGFALTHILIKSDDFYQKSIFNLAVADFDLAAAD